MTPFPFLFLLFFSVGCPTNPVLCNFKPRSFPSLHVLVFIPLGEICYVLYWAMGIILNFSWLVLLFHFLSNLFTLSISLSSWIFIRCFDLLGLVTIWVMSSAYNVSVQSCPYGGKSFVNNVYSVGESTLPCGTPLKISILVLPLVPIELFFCSVIYKCAEYFSLKCVVNLSATVYSSGPSAYFIKNFSDVPQHYYYLVFFC